MALTITKRPNTIIPAKMPVVFSLHTSYAGACRITGGIGLNADCIEPDSNKNVTFEFSDYIRDLPVLNLEINTPFAHPHAFPSVFFYFNERHGSPPVDYNYTESGMYNIINAKIPHWKRDEYRKMEDIINMDAPFLTWYPKGKTRKVLPQESIHLFFLPTMPGDYWKGVFDVLFTNGNTASFYIETLETSGKIMQFNASPSFPETWCKTYYPGQTVALYTFTVYCPDTDSISDFQTFVINRLPYTHTTQIMFRNSWGTFDQFMCKGLSSVTATSERLTAKQLADYDVPAKPDKVTWYNEGRNLLNVETGYLLKEESTWLNELLLSTEIYVRQGYSYFPVEIRSDKFLVSSDDSALLSIALEFEFMQTPIIEQA